MLVDPVAHNPVDRPKPRRPHNRLRRVERKGEVDNNPRRGLKPGYGEEKPDKPKREELDRYV